MLKSSTKCKYLLTFYRGRIYCFYNGNDFLGSHFPDTGCFMTFLLANI